MAETIWMPDLHQFSMASVNVGNRSVWGEAQDCQPDRTQASCHANPISARAPHAASKLTLNECRRWGLSVAAIILIVCGEAQEDRSRFGVVDGIRAAFGRRVRELRHRLSLSQEELADRAGVHSTYLGGIERGERNPALVNISKLTAALQVSLSEFWSVFDDTPKPGRHRSKR